MMYMTMMIQKTFYYDNYDDFECYEDAEDYFDDHNY